MRMNDALTISGLTKTYKDFVLKMEPEKALRSMQHLASSRKRPVLSRFWAKKNWIMR